MTLPPLFLVTDRLHTPRPLADAVALALAALPAGACAIVLREKDLPARELIAIAHDLRQITHRHGAWLVVSGRLDVALACGADGVHLGGEAPPVTAVRAIAPASLRIGVSLHGDETPSPEASYAFLSPVFETESKPGAVPLGLDRLREGCRRAERTPIVALGGIDASRAAACLDAGASAIAVRGAVLAARDPATAAYTLHESLRARRDPISDLR